METNNTHLTASTSLEKFKSYSIYLLIALPVIIFNWVAIFGPKVLIKDDPVRYYQVIEGMFPSWWAKHLFLCSLTEWTAWNLMTKVSPEFIRSLYVVVLLVPLSGLFYHLYHNKLGIPKPVAITAAIIPNILPAQNLIPAFINGSYVLLGTIAVMGSFLLGFRFLESKSHQLNDWLALIFAPFLYFISTQLFDHAIFFLPVFLFVISVYTRFSRKHVYLAFTFSCIAFTKAILMMRAERSSTKMIELTFSKILGRIDYYFSSMLPFPRFIRDVNYYPVIVFSIIIIIGFILNLYNRHHDFKRMPVFQHLSHKRFVCYIYGFLLVWCACNIFVFVALSPGKQVRYAYIAAFGINALLIISLYPILVKMFFNRKIPVYIFLAMLVLCSGFYRKTELTKSYHQLNRNQDHLVTYLKKYDFPPDSQVVLYVIDGENFWGSWPQGSGHLKYMLKRNDIDGMIGQLYTRRNYYNPFDKALRGHAPANLMRGIDVKRPLFLFREAPHRFIHYEYALQWQEWRELSREMRRNPLVEPKWTLFHIDKKDGKITPVASGSGYREYQAALKTIKPNGLPQPMVLWGCPPGKRDRMNLDFEYYRSQFVKNWKKQANKASKKRMKKLQNKHPNNNEQ